MTLRALAQVGYSSGGVWVAGGPLLVSEAGGQIGGLRFTGGGDPLRILGATLSLEITAGGGSVPCQLRVFAKAGFLQAPWSDANLPRPLAAQTAISDFLVAAAALQAGTNTYPLSLDLPALNAARASQAGLGGFPEWDGSFALHLHAFTADGAALSVAAVPTLDLTTDRKVFSGIEVDEERYHSARSRADFCPLTGEEMLREDMAWCEFHRRYELPDQCDIDLTRPQPVRSNPRLVNER